MEGEEDGGRGGVRGALPQSSSFLQVEGLLHCKARIWDTPTARLLTNILFPWPYHLKQDQLDSLQIDWYHSGICFALFCFVLAPIHISHKIYLNCLFCALLASNYLTLFSIAHGQHSY